MVSGGGWKKEKIRGNDSNRLISVSRMGRLRNGPLSNKEKFTSSRLSTNKSTFKVCLSGTLNFPIEIWGNLLCQGIVLKENPSLQKISLRYNTVRTV